MPFGKYHGQEVAKIPPAYLHWLANHVPLNGYLKIEVCKLLGIKVDVLDELRQQNTALAMEVKLLRAMLNKPISEYIPG